MFKVLVLVAYVAVVNCLEPFQVYSEGSCTRINGEAASNANSTIIGGFNYISGGSRYHLQRLASPVPNYDSMTEDTFSNEYCGRRNLSRVEGQNPVVTFYGFGIPLTAYEIRPLANGQGSESVPLFNQPSWDTVTAKTTLTDNADFAFLQVCWTGSDQVGWALFTRTRSLSRDKLQAIEKHAVQLGFALDNVVFLKGGACKDGQSEQLRTVPGTTSPRQGQRLEDLDLLKPVGEWRLDVEEDDEDYRPALPPPPPSRPTQQIAQQPRPQGPSPDYQDQRTRLQPQEPALSYGFDLDSPDISRYSPREKSNIDSPRTSGRGLTLRDGRRELGDILDDLEDIHGQLLQRNQGVSQGQADRNEGNPNPRAPVDDDYDDREYWKDSDGPDFHGINPSGIYSRRGPTSKTTFVSKPIPKPPSGFKSKQPIVLKKGFLGVEKDSDETRGKGWGKKSSENETTL